MSFLTEDQEAEVANLWKESSLANEETQEPVVEASQEEPEPTEIEDATSESSPGESEEQDEGHSVPYSRFKSIIEARNEYKSRTSDLESQLQELQAQLDSRSQAPKERSYLDDSYLDDSYDDDPLEDYAEDDPYASKMQEYESRIEQMEVAHEQKILQQELDQAQARYPEVTREALINAVIRDSNANVMDVAEQYSTFMSGLKEQAVAEYLRTNPGATAPSQARPDAPPRVSATVSSNPGRLPGSPDKQPKNLDEARNALFDYFKNNR